MAKAAATSVENPKRPEKKPSRAERNRARQRDLIAVTRRLFDERGMQEAPIDAIAREAGIARGLIYRQFSSKEELFVVTVTDYLLELAHLLEAARDEGGTPAEQLERGAHVFGGFCVQYPAFLDCALSLMRQGPEEMREMISDNNFLRLGQGMSRCIDTVARSLKEGNENGDFQVDDPDYLANFLWTQVLGAMHLTRIRVGVKQAAPGVPQLFPIEPEQVIQTCVDSALGLVNPR